MTFLRIILCVGWLVMLLPTETISSLGPASCFPSGRASPGGGDLGVLLNQYGFLKYTKHQALTQARLMERVSYDPQTGVFACAKKIRGLVRLGQEVGTKHPVDGYRYMTIDCTRFAAHRLAWLYVYGQWPDGVVDHINGIRDDNRISNLRDISQNDNLMNRHVATRRSRTGVLGVRPHRYGFQALIRRPGGGQKCLGTFQTIEEAKAAYDAEKDVLYPGIRHIPT